MSDTKSGLENLKESIEQMRDEIKLKAHLGQAEAKEELEQLEKSGTLFSPSINHSLPRQGRPLKMQALLWPLQQKSSRKDINGFASCFKCVDWPDNYVS